MSTKASERPAAESEAANDDSFEALLRKAARTSEPIAAARSLFAAGTMLAGGRLSVLRRIGEGGMGVVYEAFDAQRKCKVALKTLTRVEAAGVYRLKNEFRALADVRHENLVGLHELFSAEEAWFFTMELVDGERFDRWVRPRDASGTSALDEQRLRAALPQLVSAVRAVHGAGKLHRDLKPSNVLVTGDGRVVVLDFGLAVEPELGGIGQTVADDSVSGTPAYMAPEQAAGEPATAASDFYAIGAMLFEALTGRLPFEGRSGEILAAKQKQEAPHPSAHAPLAPPDLASLCAGLLALEPAQRRETIAGLSGVGADETPRARMSNAPAPTELLGREQELQALRDAFAATLSGQPVVLFLSGESGIGKSALAAAFVHTLRAEGHATVIAGRCYERENLPYKGFDALVDELSRHLRKLAGHEAAALLPREIYALARIFPVLDRVAVIAETPKKEVPDPQDLKQRAFAAFGELLARMRDRGPLVVLIDDLQWIDQDSMRFMRALLVQPEPAPVLLVCLHRREDAPHNAMLQAVVRTARDTPAFEVRDLELEPLPRAALVALAQRLLPANADVSLAEAFASEAQGSPFFAAELVRASQLHTGSAGQLSLASAISLHVASLPAEAHRLLSLLALAGQPLPPHSAIEAIHAQDGHAQLDRLRSEQLVRVSVDGEGARSVECYHDKVREQVAAGLDALGTRELALGLSRALLAQGDADPDLLVRMLELAGMPQQAAQHATRAGERAFAKLAFERAATLYTQALAHGAFEPARRLALQIAKAEALAHAGQGQRAAEAFREAARNAPEAEVLALELKASDQYLMCGDLEHGRTLLAEMLARQRMSFPKSDAAALLGVLSSRTRLRVRGLRYTPRTQHDAATLRELELLRSITHGLVRTDQVRAADYCARWVLRALEVGHEVELGRALAWEVLIASGMGADEERIEAIKALCAQLHGRTGDPMTAWLLEYTSGIDAMIRGADAPKGLAHFDRALAVLNAHPMATTSYDRSWFTYWRAFSLLWLGRVAESFELAQPALQDAEARGDQSAAIPLTALVVTGLVAVDRPAQAARVLDEMEKRLHPREVTLQHNFWFMCAHQPALYAGRAREAWYGVLASRERYTKSLFGRLLYRGLVDSQAGIAIAAARASESAVERRQLLKSAARMLKRAQRTNSRAAKGFSAPILALVSGQRADAVAALRASIPPAMPLYAQMMRRCLGVLLGDEEGTALIAEADAFLRAGGVVDPARFTAAQVPGLELPER